MLWGWHPSQVDSLTLLDFWMVADAIDAIGDARKKAARTPTP